ncbi:Exodeoxyribonuclease 7 large subunit [Polystyrenella longa]|uniref:Exodeoxyribonuclease 7 large subunit n=1 Tax=Polystyrenella longa TaxID=2528007 RepID=A0A518CUF6_9PLAN|nr:exodeoxyribonuclease VII large subunit [Polystyrenella longa]QDU82863.1 Exodeoxyribonuclease 7 large subunit [Polystyrenella longa]
MSHGYDTPEEESVWSVSELTRQMKELLESNFPLVWVAGEVSSCTRARSGHIYLTLKDENSQISAVIWKGTANRLKFDLDDGLQVIAAGAVEVYQPRGSYQLIIRELIPQGMGPLELAFRQLQAKLAEEGLFAPERKKLIPRFPMRIAVVTSPTSAAVRDMLQVMSRRWPVAEIIVVPAQVQGAQAGGEIAAGLKAVESIPNVDVVIVGRGGGSLEDLWAFNEEIVARAIAACPIPVISAVGHEIDVTIADLVADRRALTPSEAGELVVPDLRDILGGVRQIENDLRSALREQAHRARMQLEALVSRPVFARPLSTVHDRTMQLDELAARLNQNAKRVVHEGGNRLQNLSRTLEALSPLNVLSRGYSVTRRPETGEIVHQSDQIGTGDRLETLIRDGILYSRVESVEKKDSMPENEA